MPSAETNTGRRSFYRASWSGILLILGFGAALQTVRGLIGTGVIMPGIYAWLLAFGVAVMGAFVLRAMARFIAAMDELWIGIYQRSLSFAFGFAVLGLLIYPLFQYAGAPPLWPELYGGLCIVLFGAAVFFNVRRFT